MKKIMAMAILLGWAAGAAAADQVWRYVDEKTGQVSYSNVPVKGKRGEKVDIMEYPSAKASAQQQGAASAGAVPIPAEVLRELQSTNVHGTRPPSGLPPLPALPNPSSAKLSQEPARAPDAADRAGDAPALAEPKWAKEAPPVRQVDPAWAKDPFAH